MNCSILNSTCDSHLNQICCQLHYSDYRDYGTYTYIGVTGDALLVASSVIILLQALAVFWIKPLRVHPLTLIMVAQLANSACLWCVGTHDVSCRLHLY
jgi:hypothetical protein